jgi:dienelactone hydrolase
VHVPVEGGEWLMGDLGVPAGARGIVLFAHGSGSGRQSSRNQRVARSLEARGLGTLLIDLLTPAEENIDRQTLHLRFDIDLLATRLSSAITWLRQMPDTRSMRIGLFGASTGAGAALVAAANRPADIGAVVSRGGRPDLAGPALSHVTAPTLLIVGGEDATVIQMNRNAMTRMRGNVILEIVPGATHLFEEPGTLGRVADLAGEWFVRHLQNGAAHAGAPYPGREEAS